VTSLLRVRLAVLLSICLLPLALPGGAGAQDQPLITQIDIVGARKVEEATVRFKLKSRAGDAYSPEVVREDIKALYSLGYFEDIVVQADIFEGGLKLTFVLHEKPSIQSIRMVGNRKLTADKIKAKIDLVEGGIIPPGALAKNSENIRLFYEEEGYYQARVEGREDRISPQEVNVTFDILEGDKFDVGEIRIVGNKYLKEKDIKGKIQTSELYLFFFGGTLKREELRRDLDRIRAYYLDNGFLDIAVEDPEIQLDARRKRLRIIIRVQEGLQYRIGELSIKGNRLLTEPEIRGLIKSRVGGIFSRETLQGDVAAVTDRYAERGYLFADMAPVTDIQRTETRVNISLEITEGRQGYVNRIEITGNVRTRDKVIRREIRLVEGDVFNSALLQQSRRNLQSLGFFEDVKLDTKRAAAADRVDLTVDVKEKATGAFTIGGGFSSLDGAIATAGISQNNILGLGKRASLGGQIGQNANRGDLVYTDPYFMDTNFAVEPHLFASNTKYQSNLTYDQSNTGGSVAVAHHLVEAVVGGVTYTYERIRIKDVTTDAPYLIQQQAAVNNGVSETSSLTFTLTRDMRDSSTQPTKGLFLHTTVEYAGGVLDADNNFTKYSLEASQYWPLWWKFVGHIRGSISYAEPFGDTHTLPVQERFLLGGIDTIRGFRNYTVGPKDPATGDPIGGNKSFFMNNEVLFPLYEPVKMRGLVFFDMGNAFDEQENFKWSVKRSVGIGIRFVSPMGALRLELGFPVARKHGDTAGEKQEVMHFSAGTAF
jgi:outer membrane protein insertion porin family